ncbi:putative lipid II flippase FtsW [Neisseria animalis]|uniref:Probable peptidoglycan glycosyltransferase FtsW n=1 Tax=Neisseria animalis TaxID=492 RepID=A0A5P3MSE2_NEIAN|nr:putative lipid II flippase FtsW [Neisseria animalis]QEY23711.1 putative lipid II flippase FtsW [Neisseria animalis]ROW32853.1 putative lipid II flippase FtsW [Neisseria animalis]VEE09536.1 FtsW [Neisseria animalis]
MNIFSQLSDLRPVRRFRTGAAQLLDRPIVRSGQKFDVSLLWMVTLMTAFSLLMIYSASIAYAAAGSGDPYFFLTRQALFIFLGVVACVGLSFVSMNMWKRMMPWYFVLCLLLLMAVLGFGREINGATRWLHIGPFNVQPSEMFKLAAVLYLASLFMRKAEVLQKWTKILRPGALIGFGVLLMLLQPDLGSAVVVVVIVTGMLFLAGFPWRYFGVMLSMVLLGIAALIMAAPYRMARVTGFLDPWSDPLDKGYQLTHSLMAIARGEWFGVGLGASLEKRFYLPEAHTDFIFAIIGEEFGFFGMLLLVFCYGWLVLRALSIGKQARDLELTFSAYVANGIAVWLGIQSFFNIGVNIGMLPTKGLPLPLMSYGGSAALVMLVCMTLLLRIDFENRRKMRGYQVEE